jgi:hypothetical protein
MADPARPAAPTRTKLVATNRPNQALPAGDKAIPESRHNLGEVLPFPQLARMHASFPVSARPVTPTVAIPLVFSDGVPRRRAPLDEKQCGWCSREARRPSPWRHQHFPLQGVFVPSRLPRLVGFLMQIIPLQTAPDCGVPTSQSGADSGSVSKCQFCPIVSRLPIRRAQARTP